MKVNYSLNKNIFKKTYREREREKHLPPVDAAAAVLVSRRLTVYKGHRQLHKL